MLLSLIVGTIVGCGGSAPTVDPNATPSQELTIIAQDLKFDKRVLVAPAEAQVTIRLRNDDSGVRHNFAVYLNKRGNEKIFIGDVFSGKASENYVFASPVRGSYFFRCDVHPDSMTGIFVTK